MREHQQVKASKRLKQGDKRLYMVNGKLLIAVKCPCDMTLYY